jgi:hypothetical protein
MLELRMSILLGYSNGSAQWQLMAQGELLGILIDF